MWKIGSAALVLVAFVAPGEVSAQARRTAPRGADASLPRTDAGAARRPPVITSTTPNASGNLGGPGAGGGGGGGP